MVSTPAASIHVLLDRLDIGVAMLVVIGVIGIFGPRTRDLALEQIAH